MSGEMNMSMYSLSPSFLLVSSFPRKRESSRLTNSGVAGQYGFVLLRTSHSISWIPAFAGMTVLKKMMKPKGMTA
jgi:hypothetical protein